MVSNKVKESTAVLQFKNIRLKNQRKQLYVTDYGLRNASYELKVTGCKESASEM